MMRSATLSATALLDNLAALSQLHGPDIALDLRGDAYGCGAREVAHFAAQVGLAAAHYGERTPTESSLGENPDLPVVGGWWSGPGGPVVEFSADVVSVKRVAAGSPVSYGYHYRTSQETTLALVAAGYADGVPRSASGRASVSLRGAQLPIAGRIAMDQFVVDAGDAPVVIGDRCVIWGHTPSIEQWAQWAHRPEGALLAHIGHRVVKTWF